NPDATSKLASGFRVRAFGAPLNDRGASLHCPSIRLSYMQILGQEHPGTEMIVDFQHHFTPRELIKQDPGNRLIVHFDENGAPSYTVHTLLWDLDEHVAMMDAAGIDAAFLTSAAGMSASLEVSKLCNDKAKKAEKDYPGRFIASAHAH